MPSSLLAAVPLIAGYVFLQLVHYLRFRGRLFAGYRLVFEAAVYGLGLFALARTVTSHLTLVLRAIAPAVYIPISRYWGTLTGGESFIGAAVLTAGLAVGAGFIVNLGVGCVVCIGKGRTGSPRDWWQASRTWGLAAAIEDRGTPLLKLLHRVAVGATEEGRDEGLSVGITLKSRKIYAALVTSTPQLGVGADTQTVALFPLMSGFRDEVTLEHRYTYAYDSVDEDSLIDEFEKKREVMTVPLSEIASAHLLTPEILERELKRLRDAERKRRAPAPKPAGKRRADQKARGPAS